MVGDQIYDLREFPITPPQPLPDGAYIGADGIAYRPLAAHETSPFPFAFVSIPARGVCIRHAGEIRNGKPVFRVPCGRRVVDAAPG